MQIIETALPEVKIIEYGDARETVRGSSFTILDRDALEQAGIFFDCRTEKAYRSAKTGTLYGIHFQNRQAPQAKLLYCIAGRGLDYAVDLRRSSPTYLKWVCAEISAANHRQIYIPQGFGHIFLALEDETVNVMRCDAPTDPRFQRRLRWDAPEIGIPYPVQSPVLAPHDAQAPGFAECDIDV